MTAPPDESVRAIIAARTGYGRLLAVLAASSGDLAAVEDCLADAFERALTTWPQRGVPDNPQAWLLAVARNRLRDHWRSAAVRLNQPLDVERHTPVHLDEIDVEAIGDKRLELMLVCAHPAISATAHTPLMLNTVLGFTADQIAQSFAMPTTTMATRLTRAKQRITQARIPFVLPDRSQLPERMASVLEGVYGAYAIDWSTTGPESRPAPPEGWQLAEILAEVVPDDPEVRGLAALVGLAAARRPARYGPDGSFVPLAHQDPSLWDGALIDRAHDHLRAAHRHGVLGRFQLEAAIQATHCARRTTGHTAWQTLRDLHEALDQIAPTLGSRTALAAVIGETDGPRAGLVALDAVCTDHAHASRFQPAWALRGHLLARLGQDDAASAAYERALALTHDAAERAYLARRRDDPRGGAI